MLLIVYAMGRDSTSGVSFRNKEFLEASKQRAESLRLSLSEYVCFLIDKDFEEGGPLIIKEDPKPYGSVSEIRARLAEKRKKKEEQATQ